MAGRAESGTEGFARLYADEYDHIARTVYLVLHDSGRAEEITQEAFVRLYVHWRWVRHYDRPGAWVRRVAIRLAAREARREHRRPSLERQAPPPPAEGRRDPDVMAALAELPPRQRAVVVLHYFEDLSVADIAATLGMGESAVKVTLHRARRALAPRLQEEVTDVR